MGLALVLVLIGVLVYLLHKDINNKGGLA